MARPATIAGGRGGLGWVILVVALAVPGVLFYNWWSRLKVEREKAVAVKARGRVPDGGVFQISPSSSKLVNPMTLIAPAVSTVAAKTAAPAAGFEAAVWIVSTEAVSTAAVSITVVPNLKRDPMLSPFDLVRLKEEENVVRLAQERLEAEHKSTSRRAGRRAPAPETLIDLQGIISNSEGESQAIINNEVFGVGESVGKFRVLRITAAGVTFEYEGRRFTKSVNRE